MNEFIVTISVLLITLKDVVKFTQAASLIPHDIDIYAIHGNYSVDARSVMGVMSLNHTEPIMIKIVGQDKLVEEYVEYFSKWIVR